MVEKELKGVMPALVTPIDESGRLNKATLRKMICDRKKEGADGFYLAGATGEGILLSKEIRQELFDTAVEEIGDKGMKICHIADINFDTAKKLARYAEAAGADMISAIPPLYFSYDGEDIYQYYKALAGEVKIPLMLYYTAAANTAISTDVFARLSEIDNITSVKWTQPGYFKMIELIEATKGKMKVVNGPDETLLAGLSVGAVGGIGTTYNFMLPLYKEIYTAFRNGDMKRALFAQNKADKVISVMARYPVISAAKAILEAQGYDVGYAVFPQKKFTKEEKEKFISEVREAGLPV